eukprot:COSAG03_NODE_6284_length_1084_cov_1.032487_1_plen_122_part_10
MLCLVVSLVAGSCRCFQVLAAVRRGKIPRDSAVKPQTSRSLASSPEGPHAKARRLRDEKRGARRTARSSGTTSTSRARLNAENPSSSRANSTTETDVKEFMKKRGLEAWHSHLTKHLGIKTC